jgi:flavin-dependent dehydrogenase
MLTASSNFDLAVIGGGPAGSAAAITAARLGARVVLFEARDFPRHKVCGEFVSGEALELLAGLLQEGPRLLLDSAPQIDRTRLFLGKHRIEAPISPAARSITRYDLDAQLWHAAQAAGAEACAGCEVSAVAGDGPFQLTASSGPFHATAVIVAAGRWSQLTPDRILPPGPRWIGVKGHFREPNASRTTDLYFFQRGYCGVQPVANDMVNACAMVRSDCATTLEESFRLHPKLAERAARWTPVTQPVSTAPLVYRDIQPVRGSLIYAGDAAAFIDPFVGDGISIALRSGRLAAQWVCRFLAGKISRSESVADYQSAYMENFAPLFATSSRVRSLLSLPEAGRAAAFQLLRLPGVMSYLIRKTRRASGSSAV